MFIKAYLTVLCHSYLKEFMARKPAIHGQYKAEEEKA